MKTATKFNFKTLIVLILSLVLCCSLAFTAACSDSNGSSSSSSVKDDTVYPTDVQSVTNGDFEFSTFKTEAKNFPVSSSIGWSLTRDSYNSSYAPSSTYSSGIINTDEIAYAEIAEKAGFAKLDDGTYYNPGTPYDSSLIKEGEYVVRNESGKTVNDDKLPMKGNKILMIHNATSEKDEGTAQKFTSSSTLSLTKGKYGKVSLWVKTYGLKSAYSDKCGAYVAIENTVSSSLNPVIVKNIDTKGEWVKYTFYLAANDLTDSSFKVILGLGFGSGKFKNEYVEGFAYFDDVNFTEISISDYNASGATKKFDLFQSNGDVTDENALIVEADNTTKSNENKEFAEKKYAINHAGASYANVSFGGKITDGEALNGVVSVANAIAAINNTDFVGDDKIKAPVSREGNALYAIKKSATSSDVGNFEYTTASFSVASGKYYAYSFFVKSSLEVKTRTGLTVTVNDLGKSFDINDENIKTSSLVSNLCTDGYENDDYNGWRRYTVLVSNVIDADEASPATRNFSLTFSFGNNDGDNWKKAKGYFVIANFESKELSENEYSFANTTDAVKVSLTADLPNGVKGDDETTDTYNFTYSTTDALDIKNGVAKNVIGYKGVKGGSIAVGGSNENVYADANVLAGVINTENLSSSGAAKLSDAQISEINKLGKYNSTNKYLQPLMINNLSATSYGFYGESQTLAANTTTLFTVRVKTLGSAKAFVYLADANALDGFGTFKVNAEAYGDVKAVEKPFAAEVTSGYQTETDDGWYVVYFVVTTGNESKNVRVELFNGSRDGETTSTGVVLFDSVSKTTVDLEDFKAELNANYGDGDDTAEVTNYTQKPTVVKYDDDKGSLTNSLTGKKYSEKTVTHEETAVFTVYKNSKAVIGSFEAIDATHEVDERTASSDSSDSSSSDDHDHDHNDDEQTFSWALQITSIIIAAILIVLLVVVLVRMIVKKSNKNKAVTKTYYNRDSRDKAHESIMNKKAKAANKATAETNPDEVEEEKTEVKPYDYDNMENNVEPEETDVLPEGDEENVAEETVENAETAEPAQTETPAETSESSEEKTETSTADDNKAE